MARIGLSVSLALLLFALPFATVRSSGAEADTRSPSDETASSPERLGKLLAISVQPNESTTLRGQAARLQLLLTATFEGERHRDRTREATFSVQPAGVVEVDAAGRVTPLADGEATIQVSYSGKSAKTKVTVERFANPPLVNFGNEIVPIFTKLGCNGGGCHGKSGGQNGFQLSLLGFEPQDDYMFLVKEGRGRRLFPAAPRRSLLLRKACGELPHGGGVRMTPDSDEYRLLELWVAQGMPYGRDDDPVLEAIAVEPSARTLAGGLEQQLRVVARYSDGSQRDVTRQAQFTPNNKDLADASDAGVVRMLGPPGDVAVMVRYQGQVDVFRAAAPLGAAVTSLPPERNFIDKHVIAKWKHLGLPPSDTAADSTFLRRATLDIAGRLPTLEEAEAFLADDDPNKRANLIERLLDSPEYADFFAQKWAAILRNKVEPNISRGGNFRFHDWIRQSLLRNKPYDRFVREIITASGDVRRNPRVNWHRQVPTMNEKVEDTAQVFLGLRIQCARCHHHPFEKWSQQDYWGLAAFFANVKAKDAYRVVASRGVAQARHPKTQQMVPATPLDGEPLTLTPDLDARHQLAEWMTDKSNPFFAKAVVNRYWKHFFSIGLVDPEDDMRATNPPSNPELLDALAKDFVDSGFDLKHLVRTICNSSTYQLSAAPNEHNGADRQSFSRYMPKRLHAEVLLDGIDELLGSSSTFNGLPRGVRAVQIPDHGGVNNAFLNAFGRPAGASACECERAGDVSMMQSLQLLNSNEVYAKLDASRARSLAADEERTDQEKVTELCLRAFSRPPSEAELQAYMAHIQAAETDVNKRRQAYEDILWALINTKEFLFNH